MGAFVSPVPLTLAASLAAALVLALNVLLLLQICGVTLPFLPPA